MSTYVCISFDNMLYRFIHYIDKVFAYILILVMERGGEVSVTNNRINILLSMYFQVTKSCVREQ